MYNPLLDCFIYVAEHGTFTKAGEIMLISPTAVMKQINALERHLGLKLFERSNQGVVLTPVGRSVYDYALQMKQYSKQALDDIHRQLSSDTAVLRIGTSPLNPCEPFLNVWYKINSAFPRYSLNLISFGNEYSEVFSAHTMLGDKLDFVVGTCDPDRDLGRLEHIPIGEYNLCCAVPRTHPYASKRRLAVEDLRGFTLMIAKKGLSEGIDRVRADLEMNCPDVKLEDIDKMYSLEPFDRCRQVGKFFLAPECWQHVEPAITFVPVDWEHTIPCCLIYRKDPADVVSRVIQEIKKRMRITFG